MKRFAAMLLTLCLALTACAGPTQAPESRTAVTFTDDLGRSVTVQSHERVAALLGMGNELDVLALGDDTARSLGLPELDSAPLLHHHLLCGAACR